jgi:hypothetical protein
MAENVIKLVREGFKMFNKDFTRVTLSMVGALLFTVTAVGAAVGPARVAETTPLVYAGAASTAADVA